MTSQRTRDCKIGGINLTSDDVSCTRDCKIAELRRAEKLTRLFQLLERAPFLSSDYQLLVRRQPHSRAPPERTLRKSTYHRTRMDYPIKRKMKDLHKLMKGDYNVEPTFVALSVDETVKNFVNRLGQTVKTGDFDFIVQFEGPKGTLYDGGNWKVRVKFPMDYPYSPPSLVFVDPIFHPNISQSGGICVDLLGWKWDAGYDLLKVFEEILPSLLVQPNAASPYNQEASDLMLADEKAYAERVKAYNHHAR